LPFARPHRGRGKIWSSDEFAGSGPNDRFSIRHPRGCAGHHRGTDVPIGGNAVTGITLLLHEIATNAAKYGALSTESGHVNVSWSVWKDELLLAWRAAA
jgi:two-component sensor histidine kinase